MDTQINLRAGKIKTRIFAMILLILSCSMLLSAGRSLGREFSGTVIRKSQNQGIALTQYYLHIMPDSPDVTPESLIKALSDEETPLQRIGVSSVVYVESEILGRVSKNTSALNIAVNDNLFIDLGVFWMIMAIAGIAIAFWMYGQTLKPHSIADKYQPEDLDIPGLD